MQTDYCRLSSIRASENVESVGKSGRGRRKEDMSLAAFEDIGKKADSVRSQHEMMLVRITAYRGCESLARSEGDQTVPAENFHNSCLLLRARSII